MPNYSNPLDFIKTAGEVYKMAKTGRAAMDTPGAREAWKEEMYRKRWRNFLTILIFIGVCVFFLWIGVTFKAYFFFVYWYIWMGLSTIFLLVGIYTWLSYLRIIIKGKLVEPKIPKRAD